ncbi:MAG TPA: metallophosphoesterase [Planctomycetaceae bacterium]|nr:metallophosphoesterase [Planctomycetaceae bacterium]
MVGDVVGKPGMQIATAAVQYLRNVVKADAIVVNAENAADGSGLRLKDYRKLIDASVDAITLGDHVFRKREIMSVLDSESNIVRPANLASAAPGKGLAIIKIGANETIAVMSALGRVFMNPIDCPFRALDECLKQATGTKIRLVDFHAEATSDMQLMGRYLDGRVTAVLGTHTHVPTADECVLPGGTGFQCDVGMTGPHESILGRKIDAVREAVINAVPTQFQVATQDVRLSATWFDADRQNGKCKQIGRVQISGDTIEAYNTATHQRV